MEPTERNFEAEMVDFTVDIFVVWPYALQNKNRL